MTYEIIAIENGDVLERVDDRDRAVDSLISYVEENLPRVPGIEAQVALIELDDDGERRDFLTYEELAQRTRQAL